MTDPNVDYLSATLELVESVTPEMKKLCVSPMCREASIELCMEGGEGGEEFIQLNRKQIECLTDFLTAWLRRTKLPKIGKEGKGFGEPDMNRC